VGRIRDFFLGRAEDFTLDQHMLQRDADQLGVPLEGTNMSLFQSQIPTWWAENGLLPSQQWVPGNGWLSERVWVANRCIQMNSQQIASMPLRFQGSTEPAWVSSPDPAYFPNGIGDAVHAIVREMYGWGYAICVVTNRYFDGYPRSWTVLPSQSVDVRFDDYGRRVYKLGDEDLNPADVIQIDRDPGCGAHGTSALRAYAQIAWGLMAAGNQSMNVAQGAAPQQVLKNLTAPKLTKEQAEAAQTQWMAAVARRNGAPPVLDKNWDFSQIGVNPSDLALLEMSEYNEKAIATAYGVPAVLLNVAISHGLTYQAPGQLGEMWWRFELRPTAKRIADAFTAQMLPAGQWVWFDAADTFLPLDTPTTGPFAQISDDVEAAAVAQDSQAEPPAVAKASPAQQPSVPSTLPAIGGGRRL
jgi:HK97 family phage portal protein